MSFTVFVAIAFLVIFVFYLDYRLDALIEVVRDHKENHALGVIKFPDPVTFSSLHCEEEERQ